MSGTETATFNQTQSPSRLRGSVRSTFSKEISQWLSHDDSTVNSALGMIVSIIILNMVSQRVTGTRSAASNHPHCMKTCRKFYRTFTQTEKLYQHP